MDRDITNQVERAWDAYASNDFVIKTSQGETIESEELDERRRERIEVVGEILEEFFDGERSLSNFKSEIDGQNKRHPLWGFKGMNGMMFFNMLYNTSGDDLKQDLCALLQRILRSPDDDKDAKQKIEELEDFVGHIRDKFEDARKAPRSGSIPYFLSYFWQIQAPDKYPIYYTSMVHVFSDLAIWEPKENLATSYAEFWELNEEIRSILTNHTSERIHLWEVEHAFWFWQQREEFKETPPDEDEPEPAIPDSYIPPIVSILPSLANNTEEVGELAEEAGKRVESLFENRVAKCFKMLGFEVEELGQGTGRNPDGIAKDRAHGSHGYAIIYDAKVRQEGYSIGTSDERQFEDYINQVVPRLRDEGFRNLYFAVVTGNFTDDAKDVIRRLKIKTDIQEIRLIEAEALLALLENKLREPKLKLGTGGYGEVGVQDFLAESGILTSSDIGEELGI